MPFFYCILDLLILKITLVLYIFDLSNAVKEITFYVNEHPKTNMLVGNIFHKAQIKDKIKSVRVEMFNKQYTNCFYFNHRTGDLFTTSKATILLDSENMCINQVKIDCFITFLISINKRILLSVRIIIVDLNDNKPLFPNKKPLEIWINENSKPEYTKISIKPGYDPDFNGESVLYYYLFPKNSPFYVEPTTKSQNLNILLLNKLDYEKTKEFHLNLSVCDENFSKFENNFSFFASSFYLKHCSSQLIEIKIKNLNDNKPYFKQNLFTAIIEESNPINTAILKIVAVDDDLPPYDEITYQLFKNDIFEINNKTGILKLKKQMPDPGKYELWVQAIDAHSLLPNQTINNLENQIQSNIQIKSDIAKIQIQILDINNHAPKIELESNNAETSVFVLDKTSFFFKPNLIQLKIVENIPDQTVLAYFRVTDLDQSRPNNEVYCTLSKTKILQQKINLLNIEHSNNVTNQVSIYKLILKQSIDAELLNSNDINKEMKMEQIAGYLKFIMICQDHGKPNMESSISIQLIIHDKDEYYPKFEIQNINLEISLNFEQYINHQNIYRLEIEENIPINTNLLQINTSDFDICSQTKLQYFEHLHQENKELSDNISLIQFDYSSGKLFVIGNLDYEKFKSFVLKFIAKTEQKTYNLSLTHQTGLESQLIIKVNLIDQNDNAPKFIAPPLNEFQLDSTIFEHTNSVDPQNVLFWTNELRIIEVEEQIHYNYPIGQIRAIDQDSLKTIQYFIAEIETQLGSVQFDPDQKYQNKFGPVPKLEIDSNGSIWTKVSLDREKTPVIDLVIGAHDFGKPQLTSYTKVRILLKDVNDHKPEWYFPTINDFIVPINQYSQIGDVITRIRATDKDDLLKNGQLSYAFASKNYLNQQNVSVKNFHNQLAKEYFDLNSVTGEFILKKSISKLPIGFLDLWLIAQDHGDKQNKELGKLVFYLTPEPTKYTLSELLDQYFNEKQHIVHKIINYKQFNQSQFNSFENNKWKFLKLNPFYLLIGGSVCGLFIIICSILVLCLILKFRSKIVSKSNKKHNITSKNLVNDITNVNHSNSNDLFNNSQFDTKLNILNLSFNNNSNKLSNISEINSFKDLKQLMYEQSSVQCAATNSYVELNTNPKNCSLQSNFSNFVCTSVSPRLLDLSNKIPLQLIEVNSDQYSILCCNNECNLTHDLNKKSGHMTESIQNIKISTVSNSFPTTLTILTPIVPQS